MNLKEVYYLLKPFASAICDCYEILTLFLEATALVFTIVNPGGFKSLLDVTIVPDVTLISFK